MTASCVLIMALPPGLAFCDDGFPDLEGVVDDAYEARHRAAQAARAAAAVAASVAAVTEGVARLVAEAMAAGDVSDDDDDAAAQGAGPLPASAGEDDGGEVGVDDLPDALMFAETGAAARAGAAREAAVSVFGTRTVVGTPLPHSPTDDGAAAPAADAVWRVDTTAEFTGFFMTGGRLRGGGNEPDPRAAAAVAGLRALMGLADLAGGDARGDSPAGASHDSWSELSDGAGGGAPVDAPVAWSARTFPEARAREAETAAAALAAELSAPVAGGADDALDAVARELLLGAVATESAAAGAAPAAAVGAAMTPLQAAAHELLRRRALPPADPVGACDAPLAPTEEPEVVAVADAGRRAAASAAALPAHLRADMLAAWNQLFGAGAADDPPPSE